MFNKMTKLEKVARAICRALAETEYEESRWQRYTATAQAVIDALGDDGWEPIETVPLETLVFVWGPGFDDVEYTCAYRSHTDPERIIFGKLGDAQIPTVWKRRPEPPK